MKHIQTKKLVFMAICCDLGLFSKRIISPFTNIITDALHIPGGIGTSFSLMFVVIAAILANFFGAATLISMIQAIVALILGMTGSMGALSFIGYVIPGIMIDFVIFVSKKCHLPTIEVCVLANSIGALFASLSANWIVFHLKGIILLFYCLVSLFTGVICGMIGNQILMKVNKALKIKKGELEVKRNSKVKWIAGLLTIMLVIVGCSYLNQKETIDQNQLEIVYQDKSILIDLADLKLIDVQGEVVNGKGEVSEINQKGILLQDLLNENKINEYQQIEVIADDAYNATVLKEEIVTDQQVYLLVSDSQATLLVFNDTNSKRNVRNVVKINVLN